MCGDTTWWLFSCRRRIVLPSLFLCEQSGEFVHKNRSVKWVNSCCSASSASSAAEQAAGLPPLQRDITLSPEVDGLLLNNCLYTHTHTQNVTTKVRISENSSQSLKSFKLSHTTTPGKKLTFSPSPPPLRWVWGTGSACRRGVENTDWRKKTQHLPGRNSSESKTIVNVTRSQSCRLAVIWGPLLPIPIHSVRMEILGCFSSTLWLREIRQKFVFFPSAVIQKGAPVFRAALRGRGLKCKRGPEVISGQWKTNYSLTTWYLHVVAITGDEDNQKRCLQNSE